MSKEKYKNPNDGSDDLVLVDKKFLIEVAGFLQASSYYEDMGNLPYSSFIHTSHYLSNVIQDMLDENIRGRDCYSLYDDAKNRYENDPVVVEFSKKLSKLLGDEEI